MQQRKRRPQKLSDTCPKCGYCDKCGRANAAPFIPYVAPCIPYVPPTGPYPWQFPWDMGGWGGTILTSTTCEPNPNVTVWNQVDAGCVPVSSPADYSISGLPVSGSLSMGTHSTTFVGDAGAVHGN